MGRRSQEIDLALSKLDNFLLIVETFRQDTESLNSSLMIKKINNNLRSFCYLEMNGVKDMVRFNIIQPWNQLASDAICHLYQIIYNLIDILSDEGMIKLKAAYRACIDAVDSDRLFNQFREIKLNNEISFEEYPRILSRYQDLLKAHKTEMIKILSYLAENLNSVSEELRRIK